MLETHGMIIANQTGVKLQQVEAVKSLLAAGATIPFIARYRKEKIWSLGEVVISEIRDGSFGASLHTGVKPPTPLAVLHEA